jgi:hypothetical protein
MRNPLVVSLAFVAFDVAPHAFTQRWSYTVPAGRMALLAFFECGVWRAGAPTTAGRARAQVLIVRGVANVVAIAQITPVSTQNMDSFSSAPLMVLTDGWTVYGYTEDTSTGGTVNYAVSALIQEFDAP